MIRKLGYLCLLLCTSVDSIEAQSRSRSTRARLETRLRSLEQRVANLEAAQRTTTPDQSIASSPATASTSPRTTEDIERINIQAIRPQSRHTDQESAGATGAATGTGSDTTSAA